ncbi:lambda-exonuclease family protein [Oscillospiraceae bacterium 44-5]
MAQASRRDPLVLAGTANLSREDWLAYRRQGIGGSDAAAVLGISPFRTAVDLYYDKRNLPIEEDEGNWVAMEVGNLLEDLVARIFAKKTGLNIYRRKCMFRHPDHPWMLADLDFLVEMPDGGTAILECKTTNYNARDKWEYNGKPIVPAYYEVQGRHYMAVMDLNRIYFCCLYGNNEDEVIIRHIDRDMDYEEELIFLEKDFWQNNVQAQVEPQYIENNGELILESLRRLMGPSAKDAPPVLLTPPQFARVFRFLELQEEKKRLDAESNRLKAEKDRMKALIAAGMGSSRTAVYEDASGSYTVTFKPSYKESIVKDSLLRLKESHPDIYAEYVSISESRRFSVKRAAPDAA